LSAALQVILELVLRIKLRSADRAIPRMTRHKRCPVQAYYLYGKTCHFKTIRSKNDY
jgi:hypothetical protein